MEKCVARRVTEMKTRDIIVIGTSGGGLTALRELMRELPRDLPPQCSSFSMLIH
jgi:chemotaxis response regulator CheB